MFQKLIIAGNLGFVEKQVLEKIQSKLATISKIRVQLQGPARALFRYCAFY